MQADVWRKFGVSIAYGDAVMTDRMAEIMRALHPRNNEQTVQAARLLGIPYHVLPHSRRQQRERLRAGSLRRTGHRRHGRRTAGDAEDHPRIPAGGARGDRPHHLRGKR